MLAVLAMARTGSARLRLRLAAVPLTIVSSYRALGTGHSGSFSGADDGRSHKGAGALPLHFVAEATYLPELEKLARGSAGEDAYFVSRYACGVAGGYPHRAAALSTVQWCPPPRARAH